MEKFNLIVTDGKKRISVATYKNGHYRTFFDMFNYNFEIDYNKEYRFYCKQLDIALESDETIRNCPLLKDGDEYEIQYKCLFHSGQCFVSNLHHRLGWFSSWKSGDSIVKTNAITQPAKNYYYDERGYQIDFTHRTISEILLTLNRDLFFIIYQWDTDYCLSRQVCFGRNDKDNKNNFVFQNYTLYSVVLAQKREYSCSSANKCKLCPDFDADEKSIKVVSEIKFVLPSVLLNMVLQYYDCDVCRDYYWCNDNTFYLMYEEIF